MYPHPNISMGVAFSMYTVIKTRQRVARKTRIFVLITDGRKEYVVIIVFFPVLHTAKHPFREYSSPTADNINYAKPSHYDIITSLKGLMILLCLQSVFMSEAVEE